MIGNRHDELLGKWTTYSFNTAPLLYWPSISCGDEKCI